MSQQTLVGKKIGRFTVEKMLGRGGMGAVYKGVDDQTGRSVAIKVMIRSLGEDPELTRRFEREARLATEIDHPNCARAIDSGVEDDIRYLVMEYIDGKPLSEELEERGRITGSRCLDYIRQTARGLQAAFERGIIHRDIKPANLMLTKDGIIKIVDFGLARANDSNDSLKTATGAVMGTPHYISPEQACGSAVDHRADMYSLGATSYHLLTGQPPFSGDSPFAIIQKHISMEPPAITAWNPNVPEGVCQLVYRMLKKSPDDRFQTYGHLISVIDDLIEGRAATMTMHVVDDMDGIREAEEAAQDRSRMIRIGAVLAGIVVIGVLAINIHNKRQAEAEAAEAQRQAVQDPDSIKARWKTDTMPMLHDIKKEIREQDKAVEEFSSSRRSRNNSQD